MNREELRNQFQADLRKFRRSTIERKQMSTKTTFKRIALVAVAALGLGVLSVAPSSATVSAIAVTPGANGSSTLSATGYVSDSSTAATFTVAALADTVGDTITVGFVVKSAPAGTTATPRLYFYDTTTPSSSTLVDSNTALTAVWSSTTAAKTVLAAETDASTIRGLAAGSTFRISNSSAGYVGAKFGIQLDSASARVAGTHTYTIVVKSYSAGVTTPVTTNADVSIVIAADAATTALTGATAIDPSKTRAWLNAGAAYSTPSDSSVSVLSTASSTDHAAIRVTTFTAAANPAPESVTVTVTGAGVICNSGVCGKSIKVIGTGGSTDFTVRADGTAGVGSIVIATTSLTFPAKTVTFYAANASTVTASAYKPVISVGTNTNVVLAALKDANGNTWAGSAYIYAASAADALIAGSATPVLCTYTASIAAHLCPVTGTTAGTAKLKVIDASTVALSKATSADVSVRVSSGTPTTVKLAFDKATYAPGEKAQVWVTALDAAGLALPEQTITNIFATGGITSSTALSTGSDVLTSTDAAIAGATSATDGTVAGYKVYTVYMPFASGDVKITATGGTGVALAGRVEVSASATVVNSSVDAATDAANEATDAANAATDAALAAADAADAATAAAQDASDAVAALSASVSKLISSLRAQITSLTNLVIKIQKKVRA